AIDPHSVHGLEALFDAVHGRGGPDLPVEHPSHGDLTGGSRFRVGAVDHFQKWRRVVVRVHVDPHRGHSTTMVPFSQGCGKQKYSYVPGASRVTAYESPGNRRFESNAPVFDVAVWMSVSLLLNQISVPARTVRVPGT